MTAVRLEVVRLRDLTFRDYEVWQGDCEPQTVMAIDATSAAESVHREWDEKSLGFTPGPTDWKVKNKHSGRVTTVRVTGEIVAEYSGVGLGGVEKPERSQWG